MTDLPRLTPEQADLLTVEGQHRMSPDTDGLLADRVRAEAERRVLDVRVGPAREFRVPTAAVVDEDAGIVTPEPPAPVGPDGTVRVSFDEVEKTLVAAKIDAIEDVFHPVPNRADRRAYQRRAKAKHGRRA